MIRQRLSNPGRHALPGVASQASRRTAPLRIRRCPVHALLLAGLMLSGLALRASGDDAVTDSAVPPDSAPATAQDKESPAAQGKSENERDENLVRQLKPGADNATEIARLERAIDGMRRSVKLIEADNTSSETLNLQKQVIEDLEALLELLKKQQKDQSKLPPPSQSPPPSSSPQERQQLQKQQLDPQNSGRRQQGADQRRGSSSERTDEEKSRDAQERLDPAKSAQAEEARRQQMIKDVWGHLPPHLREAMRNTFSEKYLPKYEDLVKRYYEALAEKNRRRSDK